MLLDCLSMVTSLVFAILQVFFFYVLSSHKFFSLPSTTGIKEVTLDVWILTGLTIRFRLPCQPFGSIFLCNISTSLKVVFIYIYKQWAVSCCYYLTWKYTHARTNTHLCARTPHKHVHWIWPQRFRYEFCHSLGYFLSFLRVGRYCGQSHIKSWLCWILDFSAWWCW